MTSHDIMDQTPFRSAKTAVEWHQLPFEVAVPLVRARPDSDRTTFTTPANLERAVEFAPSTAHTRASHETEGVDTMRCRTTDPRSAPDALAQRENDARIRFLAQKHAGIHLNIEDEARLASATARVRLLIPRVTAADMEHLAAKFDKLRQISERLEDIKRGIEDDL